LNSFFATYYPTSGNASVEATLLVFEKTLSIGYKNAAGENEMIKWKLRDTVASFELSRQITKLKNNFQPGEIHIDGKEAAVIINELKNEEQKSWYKKENGKQWMRNSLLLTGILGLLFFLYILIVPWLSEKMASNVSVKTEQQLGDAVYDALGLNSLEDKEASLLLNDFFHSMSIATPYSIRVSVVKDNTINAFALPGGRIVVYDALLQKIESYPELAALLCHEFTHVNNKHSSKSIFRRLGSKVFLGLLFGRFGTVTSILVNHADELKSLTYSRSLEKEADLEGLSLLLERKINPDGFGSLFTHLKNSSPAEMLPEFLGSHPDIEKRIGYISAASKGAIITDDLQLKAIFEKIKQ
jgi:Zn-dependent protease with chaperone function